MAAEWERVRRLAADEVVEAVLASSGVRLHVVRPLVGGEVGAAVVALPSGMPAVLSAWPAGSGARADAVGALVDRLRGRGYPAPAYLLVVEVEGVTAVVQELVHGVPVGRVAPLMLRTLLELNGLQRDVLDEPSGALVDLYLDRDGPGFCLHDPLRRHSTSTAALLQRIHEVGRALAPSVGSGRDVVHGDFHPGNVLAVPEQPHAVAGVVDWTGCRVGDCGLDLVTLGFSLDHEQAAPDVRALLREHVEAVIAPDALLAFSAHMALRQVDWAIRHHDADEVRSWTGIAERWLSAGQDRA